MKSNDNLLLNLNISYLIILKSNRFLYSEMETIKDCLDFIDVVRVVDYKTIETLNNLEQMRECIIEDYEEENLQKRTFFSKKTHK